ncbi:J domain-containing protein [Natrinema sp. J7-2]|uniref:J domain-containing protein n=1 Tax=Natrinema sp. (strain J7-2) TaxID=406552 RepID=UPI00026D4391|nr:J domain-containing protein [Natrinema sp. J7-2]AFO58256.1 heat shock protein DnaJ domain protein [Natrinema sp. J7-2]
MGDTYYDVLGVDPDATRDEIESAYRDRVLETHPDHSDHPDAAERFQRVMTAKSVLTDETERARYDRLGHEAYVDLDDGAAADSSDASERSATASSRTNARRTSAGSGAGATGGQTTSGSGTATGTGTAGSDTAGGRTTTNGRQTSERTETDDTAGTESHHARQRSKRRRQRAKRQAAAGWSFDEDETARSSAETATAAGATTDATTETTDTAESEGTAYSVHDWNDEVDLEWEGPRIDQTAVLSLGTAALLYPLFVAASLTPLFSLPINAVIAACTLALIGYLLTMPRIAAVTFGIWSVLFPVGITRFESVELLSLFGLLALAFAWIPLGYAGALWWVLRP